MYLNMSNYIGTCEHILFMHYAFFSHVSVYIFPWTHIEAWNNDVGPTTFAVSKETKFIFSFLFYFVFILFKHIFIQWSRFGQLSLTWLSTNTQIRFAMELEEVGGPKSSIVGDDLISLNDQQVLYHWKCNTDFNR